MGLRLSRFLSDGMIVQREHAVPVWGTGEPGRTVHAEVHRVIREAEDGGPECTARAEVHRVIREEEEGGPGCTAQEALNGCEASAQIGEDGRFELPLPALPAGGPYELTVTDSEGESAAVKDILSGALWFVSGQSNIDVTMERCADSYPEIIRNCRDDSLRTFHVEANADYHGPLEEPLTGSWKKAELNNIYDFSATGYFFARKLRELTGLPVGFIQASLGGSRITSWMSCEMLVGDPAYQPLLDEADRYAQDDFMAQAVKTNEKESAAWRDALDAADRGLSGNWKDPEAWNALPGAEKPAAEEAKAAGLTEAGQADASGRAEFTDPTDGLQVSGTGCLSVPCFFRDTKLSGFTGAVWLAREVGLPAEMAGFSAGLWLGTMVDADTVWVNGVKVGETGYSYPPRKYRIPEGVLRSGRNVIVIRLIVQGGEGRITPGKSYMIYNDQGVVDLRGSWQYRIGASCSPMPAWDQVNWKATGLFNGTAAPCFHVPVEGMVWYQGEANTHEPYDYLDLTRRYVEGYRRLWGMELPYLYTQLPNFDIDLTEEEQWPELREKQRQALSIPKTGMAVTMDLGEDNDLHPHGKRQVGERLALWAAHLVYDMDAEYTGPVPARARLLRYGKGGFAVRVELTHAAGLYADSPAKGRVICDCEVVDGQGNVYPAQAEASGGALLIYGGAETIRPVRVRYAYHNVIHGAMVYNGAGLPMTPFVMDVD